jgi:hypothetical protein
MGRYITLTGVSTTDLTAPKVQKTFASDSFTRADGAFGTAPLAEVGGKNWKTQYGTYLTIVGGQVGGVGITNPSNPQALGAKAVIDAGSADFDMSMRIVVGPNVMGPIFRTDANFTGGYRITGNGPNQIDLSYMGTTGGNGAAIKSYPGIGMANGMVMRVVGTGSTFKIYRDGVLLDTVIDATWSGTHHGFRLAADNHRIDDFVLRSAP